MSDAPRGTAIPQATILRDVAAVSDGTLATLTGKKLYVELDIIQAEWFAWVEAKQRNGVEFLNWPDAWARYTASA